MNTISNIEAPEVVEPSITWLNMTGDISVTWDEENRDAVIALVEAKLQEGYSFFILKPRFFGLFGQAKQPVTSIDQVKAAGSVVIPDSEAKRILERTRVNDAAVETAIARGKLHLVSSSKLTDIETVRRARSAQEVVKHQTVAVRRIAGG
jgi:hypothetical protein